MAATPELGTPLGPRLQAPCSPQRPAIRISSSMSRLVQGQRRTLSLTFILYYLFTRHRIPWLRVSVLQCISPHAAQGAIWHLFLIAPTRSQAEGKAQRAHVCLSNACLIHTRAPASRLPGVSAPVQSMRGTSPLRAAVQRQNQHPALHWVHLPVAQPSSQSPSHFDI